VFINDLPTPALLLDLDILQRNLDTMAHKARSLGVALRPHIKTHKCLEIARMQRELGARGITVATLAEAEVFADAGFDDITNAFPLEPGKIARALDLAARLTLRQGSGQAPSASSGSPGLPEPGTARVGGYAQRGMPQRLDSPTKQQAAPRTAPARCARG